jgi:iron complex outermembrane receptor protein
MLLFILRKKFICLFFICPVVIFSFVTFTPSHAQEANAVPSASALKKLSVEELLNIEITSVSKRPERLSQTSSAVQVITQEDIRHSGATSVAEALKLAANLQTAQANASQWAISARGFNNVLANKLLVIIDGRVAYTPMYAGVFWDVQNVILENIDRIEVISGPGGTLWGSNAVNGVINVITKKASETKGVFAEAAVGTELRALGSLRLGGSIGEKITYRIYGSGFKRDHTVYADSVDFTDDWQLGMGGFRVDWEPTDKDMVTVHTNYYNGRPDPDGGSPVVAKGNNTIARWTHAISEESDFKIQLYYDETWRDFRNEFTERLRTYDFEGQHRVQLGERHEMIYGLGFRKMDHVVENLELFGFLPANKSLYIYNIFLQDRIALIDEKLDLTLGIKLEHHTYSKFQYQPNVRLSWLPTDRQTVWGSVSRAVRNPARLDREFQVSLAPNFPFITGSDFKPEEVIAFELGWRFQPKDALTVSVSGFYNVYDNIRSVEPGPAPFGLPLTFGNGVEGNTHGLEIFSIYQVNSWWRLRGGYTWLEKDLTVKDESEDANNASAESNDPMHQVMLQSIMDIGERIEAGAVLRYVGALPEPVVKEYVGLDLRAAYKIHKKIELSIVGQNLIKSSHVEFIPDSPFPLGIERSVYVKVACRL